jgi:competence transcription factor ComK
MPPLVLIPGLVGVFPTESYKNVTCVWIFNHPFEIEILGKKKSKVIFENGTFLIVNVSKEVLRSEQ